MSKTFSWVAVLLGMILIFHLSSQVAEQSNHLSSDLTAFIIKALGRIVPGAELDLRSANNVLRKGAHFFAYLALGILVINALRRSGLPGYRCVLLALGICVLYAITDELHQLFIPGRGGQVRDVIIDSIGAGAGIGLYRVLFFRR